jgi:hypothetical protein
LKNVRVGIKLSLHKYVVLSGNALLNISECIVTSKHVLHDKYMQFIHQFKNANNNNLLIYQIKGSCDTKNLNYWRCVQVLKPT